MHLVGIECVKSCNLPPLILSRKESVFLGPEEKGQPYLFM